MLIGIRLGQSIRPIVDKKKWFEVNFHPKHFLKHTCMKFLRLIANIFPEKNSEILCHINRKTTSWKKEIFRLI